MPDKAAKGPRRVQCRRTKGWRKPDGAIYVGRPSRYGNPWLPSEFDFTAEFTAAELAVAAYQAALEGGFLYQDDMTLTTVNLVRSELRGHDLMCWCPLTSACHADVLLEIANA